jgi:hypothetical protein
MVEEMQGVQILEQITSHTGMLWERIAEFRQQIKIVPGALEHHTPEMEEVMPLKHHIKDGVYTREIFMPKGMVVISFIHKTNHPSFFMSGEMSIITDKAEVKRIKAPMVLQTEMGTQRIAYMHEDCVWACVYRTDAETVEEAEKELYTENFRELPEHLINKHKIIQ